jgi:dihydroxyacid dehydratase/phosphogluconate dehydratase
VGWPNIIQKVAFNMDSIPGSRPVQDGDVIWIELNQRTITLLVSEDELLQRLSEWRPPTPTITSGWLHIYGSIVQPIEQGAVLSARDHDA